MPFVTFHYELMRPANHIDVIRRVELRHDVASEEVARSTGRNSPPLRVYIDIPKQN